MKRDVELEQFFTKPEIAKQCISQIDLSKFNRIIEPSAGSGSFSKQIPNCEAFDLSPMDPSIKQQDFLTWHTTGAEKILFIGNPPFGRQSSLAIKFINHAAQFANTIAFILPRSFSKESMLSKLNKHLILKEVFELPKDCFFFGDKTFDIPCNFFVFEYSKKEREEFKKYKTTDFEFCKKENADFSIRRVGFYAGKVEGLDVSESSHYFVKDNNNSIDILRNIKYNVAVNTVGAKSLSKNEIIKEYLHQKELINS